MKTIKGFGVLWQTTSEIVGCFLINRDRLGHQWVPEMVLNVQSITIFVRLVFVLIFGLVFGFIAYQQLKVLKKQC